MLSLLDLPLLAGVALALSLAAPPGPINALIADSAARRGFWAGWLYGLGAIAGDLTMLLLTGLGVLRLVEGVAWFSVGMAAAGAGLMAWFAWGAWRTARVGAQAAVTGAGEAGWRKFGKAYLIVTTSPFNWGWWLTAGASMLTFAGWTVALGFLLGLLVWTVAWAGLATVGGARVRRLPEIVSYAAAFVLALFALVMAWTAFTSGRAILGL